MSLMPMQRQDWEDILLAKDVDERLEDLQVQGVIRRVFPSLQAMVGFGGGDTGHKDLWAHTRQVVKQTIRVPILRWASLFHDVGKPQAYDIKDGQITFHGHEAASARIFKMEARRHRLFTPEEISTITFILRSLGNVEGYDRGWTDSAVRRLGRDLGDYTAYVFAVARADCTTKNSSKRRRQMRLTHELYNRIKTLQFQDAIPQALPKGLGTAVQAHLKIEAGPELGRVLAGLKARVESGELPRNADIQVYLDALKG
jgi:poly(A) polymerase